ncbi:hypothetical protein BDW71DRAFT_194558 [Aspergillus fruticulosus]
MSVSCLWPSWPSAPSRLPLYLTVGCYPEDYHIVQNDLFDGLYSFEGNLKDQTSTLQLGTCERFVCNGDAAVYWCNNNRDRDAEVEYKQVAEAAWTIIHDCGVGAQRLIYVAGVVVYPTKVRAVVIKDNECLNQN